MFILRDLIVYITNVKDPYSYDSKKELKKLTFKMIEILETKLVKISFKKFKPQGYTSSAIIEASDIVIHTYPEYSFLNIHVSTCSKNSNPIVLINFFNNIGDVIYKYNEYVLGGEKDG